jgi:hypothetical protein
MERAEKDLNILTQNKPNPLEPENSCKSFTIEPEMEDFNDSALLRNLIQELGIEDSLVTETDPLKHDPLSPNTCVHCKLLKKITSLQGDITKMNQEICATNEILNLKKEQNGDLKGMIRRLEESLGKEQDDRIDKGSINCTCNNKCRVF